MAPLAPSPRSRGPLQRASDDALMVRCGKGETHALSELVFRHQDAAYRYCWRVFRDHHLAEDLTQDFFVKLFRYAVRYDPRGHFTTWFYRVLANLCYDALRRRKRRKKLESILIDPVESEGTELEPLSPHEGPDEPVVAGEAKDAVHGALASLPAQVRKALELREFEGLRYREIAHVLDLSLNEVKVLLHRGRKLLARALLGTPVGRDWAHGVDEPPKREHRTGESSPEEGGPA